MTELSFKWRFTLLPLLNTDPSLSDDAQTAWISCVSAWKWRNFKITGLFVFTGILYECNQQNNCQEIGQECPYCQSHIWSVQSPLCSEKGLSYAAVSSKLFTLQTWKLCFKNKCFRLWEVSNERKSSTEGPTSIQNQISLWKYNEDAANGLHTQVEDTVWVFNLLVWR